MLEAQKMKLSFQNNFLITGDITETFNCLQFSGIPYKYTKSKSVIFSNSVCHTKKIICTESYLSLANKVSPPLELQYFV